MIIMNFDFIQNFSDTMKIQHKAHGAKVRGLEHYVAFPLS